MKKITYRWFYRVLPLLLSWTLLFSTIQVARAQNLQAIPPLTALVMDETNTLSAAELDRLDAKLKTYEKNKGSQIGILIVPTTAPEDVFSYAQRAAETYKLGRKGVGDGVLIVVAKNDRKMHLYVMRALEGAIPDAYAKRIINEQMQPAFRQGQFAAGLDAATTQIEKLLDGEQLPPPTATAAQNKNNDTNDVWTPLLMLTLAASFIGSGIAKSTNRLLVVPTAAAITGFIALDMTSLISVAALIAGIVGLAITIFGKHYTQLATQRSSTRSRFNQNSSRQGHDVFWGDGFGGRGHGGFSGGGWGGSGGGGDAGGGGASGGW
ncbi:TPM domain-containing protein [Hydromonas duriensis]|nr:TPM domain-containing protein [Hydromonas duriensis]